MASASLENSPRGFLTPSTAASEDQKEKLGDLKVKLGAARFLSAGNSVSATQGTLRINGFNARLNFNKIKVKSKGAAGIKTERRVKMPFTKQLAQISNQAAAAYSPANQVLPSDSSTATTEERRQRVLSILRLVLPVIRRRLMMARMGNQEEDQPPSPTGSSVQPEAPVSCSENEAESCGHANTQTNTQEGQVPENGGAAPQDYEMLARENMRLRRMVRVLSLAVRGLIRHSVKLQRKLDSFKEQGYNNAAVRTPEEGSSKENATPPYEAPSVESPDSFRSRSATLIQQYPRPPSMGSPVN
ncbi:uncharacterized protein LOC34619577 [Cyclospora cayetanensis]|uniref:Uncharacterized protein LOC34619577 n=1 Tax=Cyclospora cayetanensis TaxID=88456 RepID=A0A6P5WD53_9EIME|nr:uncharacterized protein LOC34619577 [Cyclospora cayetanensis]